MKKVMFVAMMAIAVAYSASAQALSANSSWSEILAKGGVVAEFPQINFSNAFVPLSGICVDGDGEILRTKYPITRCTNWGGGDNHICLREETGRLSRSRTYTYEKCLEQQGGQDSGDCRRSETRTAVYPTSYMVSVLSVRSISDGGDVREFLFNKQYDLEACR